ncbi:MAG: transglutaminase-like domain-containing protein [Planctomycetota bacterium]
MKAAKKVCLWITAASLMFMMTLCAQATAQEETLIKDSWIVSKMAGDEVGWVNEKRYRIEGEDGVRYKSEMITKMEMKRFGQTVAISIEGWSIENEQGGILEMYQKNMLSETATIFELKVTGDKALLTTTTIGKPRETEIEWDPEVLGVLGVEKLRREKGAAPGTAYEFKTFTFEYVKVFHTSVTVQEKEETEMLDGEKANLVHVVSTTDIMPGLKIHEWWDDDLDSVKTSMKMMGLVIESYLTTEERAKQASGAELKADMILETMAKANINLPAPYRLDSILYRFKAKDPDLGLPEDMDRFNQDVIEIDGDTMIVRIHAKVPKSSQPVPLSNPPPELFDYLESNAFLQSDHPALKAKALEVIGLETDAWKAACKLENFVYTYIADKNFGTGFATAAEVLDNPCGDCSEHGVFLAALCRAVGIPARVAMGYMYLGGIFGGHMWAEVWIDGEWYPLDGVMGIGRVDPTHITFTTSSLKEGGLGASFAKAIQGLGNLDLEILEITRDGETIKFGESFKDYRIEGDTYINKLYGVSITKPEDYEFEDFDRDFSGVDFTLVEMDGDTEASLEAYPAMFSFSLEQFKDRLTAGNKKLISELSRKVDGQTGAVYMLDDDGKQMNILAVIHGDTCFSLVMRIEDEERDMMVFEKLIKTIRFID